MFICYALGKELHDLGRYKQAFEAFSSGSSIRRRNLKYDVSEDERKMLRIRQAFSSVQGGVERDPTRDRHIFIIGLPRSGTTLVERILGGAPGVRSNGETDNLSNALMSCVSSTSGDIFDRCANAPANAVAQAYDRAAAHDDFSGVIIEKLPLNFLYAGAIARSFPSSPIVWVRRHPVDNCFAMFRTLFGAGYPFSYDFEELARYYSAYLGLMRHWKRTIPNRMTEVDYDELVVSPRDVAKPLTERCGLPWSDDLLDLARNRTVSLTASASQVRGPIYASSSGIRREYESQLEPLSRLLKQNGVDLSLVE